MKFDFDWFLYASNSDKETVALSHPADGLRDVARRREGTPTVVDSTTADCHSSELCLRLPVRSLRRMHPNRKLWFNVIRKIQRGAQFRQSDIAERSTRVQESIRIDRETYGVTALTVNRKSKWCNDIVQLTDTRGRGTFRLSTKRLVARHKHGQSVVFTAAWYAVTRSSIVHRDLTPTTDNDQDS